MINTVVLTGRLTKDPELKYSQSGVAVCRFTLAVNRAFANANGDREADFPNILTFKKQAENVANYLKKGSLVGVEGRIQTSSFDGKDGNRVFLTEVVARSIQFLDTKNNNSPKTSQNANTGVQGSPNTNTPNDNYNTNNDGANAYSGQNNSMDMPEYEVNDDDLPF